MPVLETTLTAVCVYPDRARVTRVGRITLEPGTHLVEVAGLPPQLDPNSLRAKGSSPAGLAAAQARLVSVQVQRTYYSETPAEDVHGLEVQVENTRDRQAGLQAQEVQIQEQRQTVKTLAEHTDKFALALAAGELSVEQELDILDGLRKRAADLDVEMLALAGEKRQLERELKMLENQLAQLKGARPRQGYRATATVEVQEGGQLDLEFTYVVSAAGWQPLYDLRLLEPGPPNQGSAQLEVGYLAQVTQQTGESWEKVSLTLSTARPALAGTLPELEPFYLRPAPPVVPALPPSAQPRQFAAAAVRPQMNAKMDLTPSPAMAAPMAEAVAQVESSGMAVTYQAAGSATIPPDGQPHRVTVARFPLEPGLDYVTAPGQVQAVYRRARLPNTSPYTLLPGPANLFVADEFIGATSLELIAPQGEIELYLGVDDRVKVERELKRREVDKTLIGGKRRVHYAYEIKLENLLGTPASLLLHDQIPVSRHEEIKIRLDTATPKPTRQTELNLLDWELTLPPKEKLVVRYDYTIEHPATMKVIGLD
jgi:uncharacterized protein (TIGR02231 family)